MEFCTLKLFDDLFVLIHADEEVVAVFAHLSLEPLGVLGGIGGQVGLDCDEYLAALEASPGVLVDSDLDVWVEETEHLGRVGSQIGFQAKWQVWADNSPKEHETG